MISCGDVGSEMLDKDRDMRRMKGFTLIELMIVVVVIIILGAVVVPALMKLIRHSKTTEATMNIRKLFDASVSYYGSEHSDATGTILAKQFPPSAGPSPGAKGSCCGQPGDKCPPSPTNFQGDTWSALNFALDEDPFYYVYQYVSSGTDTGASFRAYAFGDLDCDSVYSTYMRAGKVLGDHSVSGGSGLFIKDDIE